MPAHGRVAFVEAVVVVAVPDGRPEVANHAGHEEVLARGPIPSNRRDGNHHFVIVDAPGYRHAAEQRGAVPLVTEYEKTWLFSNIAVGQSDCWRQQ